MKPIFFGIGITAAWAGAAALLLGSQLDFLSPWWGAILRPTDTWAIAEKNT